MATLRVFNVGHGEAMTIKLENNIQVIRDFGKSSNAILTKTSIELIRILECCHLLPPLHFKLKIDVILSHAHEDNCNGF